MAFLFGYEVAFGIGLLHNELFVWYELGHIIDGFYECHSVFKAAVFVSVSQYVFSIGRMWLVSSDISGMFSVYDGYGSGGLSNVRFIACPACEFIYATFVLVQIVAILAIHFSVFGLLCHGVCGSVCYV